MKKVRVRNIFCFAALNLLISSCGMAGTLTGQNITLLPVQSGESTVLSAGYTPGDTINAVFQGKVVKLLPDDNYSPKHQKFLFQITSGYNGEFNGEVVLVAHNLDVAPYVPLKLGSNPEIKGDLLTGETPKVLHWTHRDLKHRHPDGYIKVVGKIYQ
jgi:hypothetical protein